MPVMSKFVTRLDCLEERDKWNAARIEQLEREKAEMEATMRMIATADENGICDNGYSAGYIARGATATEGGEV